MISRVLERKKKQMHSIKNNSCHLKKHCLLQKHLLKFMMKSKSKNIKFDKFLEKNSLVTSSINSYWLKITIYMFFKFLNKEDCLKSINKNYKIIYIFNKKKYYKNLYITFYLQCIHVLYVIYILFCRYLCKVESLSSFFFPFYSISYSWSWHLFLFNLIINYPIRIIVGFFLFIY